MDTNIQKKVVGTLLDRVGALKEENKQLKLAADHWTALRKQYVEVGFCVVDDTVDAAMIERLKGATDRITEKTRTGVWKHRRGVNVPFPPYRDDGDDTWGANLIMDPELGEHEILLEWMGSPGIVGSCANLMQCGVADLQLELCGMLYGPELADYALPWHRDTVSNELHGAEELAELSKPHFGVQWNTPLFDDTSFVFVPGSHRRSKTPEELEIIRSDPKLPLPGQHTLHLKAGQTCFYNQDLLHRGVYDHTKKRATLHACLGKADGGHLRAWNVSRVGIEWMKDERFVSALPPSMKPVHKNLWDNVARALKENALSHEGKGCQNDS
jgi:hypothetical protein